MLNIYIGEQKKGYGTPNRQSRGHAGGSIVSGSPIFFMRGGGDYGD